VKYVIIVTTGKPNYKFDCILKNKIYNNEFDAEIDIIKSQKEDYVSNLSKEWDYRIIPIE
jgi:hypothetical protein